MTSRLVVALIAVIAVPPCALAQQSGKPHPTVADAQRVVKIVGGDKTKLQAYCDLVKTSDEIQEAMQGADAPKSAELAEKSDTLAHQVGPEFIALMDGFASLDDNSPDGAAIDQALDDLDRRCPK